MYNQNQGQESPKHVEAARKIVEELCSNCSHSEMMEFFHAIKENIGTFAEKRLAETHKMIASYEEDRRALQEFLKQDISNDKS